MKIFSKILLFTIASGLLLGSSKEEPVQADTGKGMATLNIKFESVVDYQPLVLNKKKYINASGESFSISQLQYFVSNIKIRRLDGKEYIINQDDSYFLLQENELATHTIKLKVPAGDYNQLTFVVGVDSVRNTMLLANAPVYTGSRQLYGQRDVLDMEQRLYLFQNGRRIFSSCSGPYRQPKVSVSYRWFRWIFSTYYK